MKRHLLIITMAASLLCGCAKDDRLTDITKTNSKLFTCTIESDDATKTTLNEDFKVSWEETDEIRINGIAFRVSEGAGTGTAIFTKKNETDPDPSAPYYAFYADGDTSDDTYSTTGSYALPGSYTCTGGSFNMPMYANGDSDALSFKNICSVVKLVLTPSCGLTSINSITVSSGGQLNGAFTATPEGAMTFTGEASDAEKKVQINTSATLETSEPAYFFIPVAPGEHQLNVKISGEGGEKYKTMTSAFTFERNKIYTLTEANFKCCTVGSTDNTSGWWTAFSDYYTISASRKAHITFTNYSDREENYHNWILVLSNQERSPVGYTEYAVIRCDNNAWGNCYNPAGLNSYYNWEIFKDDMDGSYVDMWLTLDYGRLNMTSTITSTGGTVYNYSYKSLCLPLLDQYNFFFTVEKSHIGDLNVEYEDYQTPVQTLSSASEPLVGLENNTSAWWTSFSNYYKVQDGQMAVVNFKNHTDKAQNYHNWVLVCHNADTERGGADYLEYMTLRPDAYGWNNGLNTLNNFEDLCLLLQHNYDWNTFKDDMDGADIELRIYPMNGCVCVEESVTTSGGKSYYMNFVSTVKTGMKDFSFYFTVEKAHMSDVTVDIYGIPS